MPAVVPAATVLEDPQSYERDHVHTVYDEIAPHFSSTRYKPWPIIAQFLSSLPTGWVGIDSGTGNGKYLPLPLERPGSICTIGLDRSRNLLEIARRAGEGEGDVVREVVWGDVLGDLWRPGAFDYAISIATIHHLSTAARRKAAVQRLLQCISPSHGRALIYVWAIEQDEFSKRDIPVAPQSDDIVGWTEYDRQGQDVFVPWVLTSQTSRAKTKAKPRRSHQVKEDDAQPSPLVPEAEPEAKVYNRYYHMFAKGELLQLICDAANDMGLLVKHSSKDISTVDQNSGDTRGIEIVQDGWERSNYYVELRRWET